MPEAHTSTVIRARGVVKRYGRTVALAGVDTDIGPGITGLLGSNGAGKTTFISLALGLRSRDGGELIVLGNDPAVAGIEMRARIGYAPEHHDLPTELSATDLVRHLAEMHLLPRRAAVQRANDALWLVGLGEERFRPVGTMSTGQRQRVKLASAIAHDPELVLLAGDVAVAALPAASLAGLAYAGIFVAAGLWFRRAAWWGLAFVLLWENAVAHLAEGSARFTVVGWASSVLATAPAIDVSLSAGSAVLGFVMLPAIALAGWLAATVRYRRADVD